MVTSPSPSFTVLAAPDVSRAKPVAPPPTHANAFAAGETARDCLTGVAREEPIRVAVALSIAARIDRSWCEREVLLLLSRAERDRRCDVLRYVRERYAAAGCGVFGRWFEDLSTAAVMGFEAIASPTVQGGAVMGEVRAKPLAEVLYEAHELALQARGQRPVMIEWSTLDASERAIWRAVAAAVPQSEALDVVQAASAWRAAREQKRPRHVVAQLRLLLDAAIDAFDAACAPRSQGAARRRRSS